jgi:hypothetical protein
VGLGGVSAAFVWVYRKTQDLWTLLGAYIAGAIAAIVLVSIWLSDVADGKLVAVTVLLLIAAPFAAVWWRDRKQWWALIPAYVMLAVSGVVLIGDAGDEAGGMLVTAYVMFAIAAPFVVVYLLDRANWWALIPAGVLGIIGVGAAISALTSGDISENAIALLLALAFIGAGSVMLFRAVRSR